MKHIIEKLKMQESLMAIEKGPFDLFALFLREDAPDKWDLVIAAKWIDQDKPNSLRYVANNIQKSLTPKELLMLSKIVIIDGDNPALATLNDTIHVEHGDTEIRNSHFFGLPINHAHLITSQNRPQA